MPNAIFMIFDSGLHIRIWTSSSLGQGLKADPMGTSAHASREHCSHFGRVLKWGIRNGRCPRVGCSQPETLSHIFGECSFLPILWAWLEHVGGKILCRPISLTRSCVLYSTGLDNRRDSLLVLFLISVVKWLVWCSRCETMFDGSRVDTDQVLRRTRAAVRDRIKLDFVRLNLTEFRTTWCVRDILCDVVDDHLVIHDF